MSKAGKSKTGGAKGALGAPVPAPTKRKQVAKVAKSKTVDSAAAPPRRAAERSQAAKAARAGGRGRVARRADFGAPIEGFFAKQPPALRAILEALRAMVAEVAPDAQASLKWGMPFYSVGGAPLCALGGHKGHVNLILAGPAELFADPDGRLAGTGKTGRHLKLTSLAGLRSHGPRVRGWLRSAVAHARKSS